MGSVTAAETYGWSVEAYQKLGEAGIFHEDEQVISSSESVAPLAFPDEPVAVAEILPP